MCLPAHSSSIRGPVLFCLYTVCVAKMVMLVFLGAGFNVNILYGDLVFGEM